MHRQEIAYLSSEIGEDVDFQARTYQEVIARVSQSEDAEREYAAYLIDRYML